ncbi:helix-turn-helix domain-containing protein [Butyrivibrio sp. XPD2002]|jgi:transcriptional regulator with XRE-family HTH domain|uniref:helix-turn-helix domain-containing protein n=1 Tax=Butyrivibrio sp. XPD2002 TaxID=1280665 RepID=UPI0003F9CCB7|nr:helix-turn-helix transcriptional regulator [Butyrivibrio sp. XPD2002]MBQ3797054.1 helix-turn-helix transcriptional regulator [Butyrivibrio sp.]
METKNIGERLRLLRTRSNMSQEELARKLHLGSRSAVSELEMEKRTLSPTMIREYAELFDVSADWIIFGQDDKERMERKIETDEILKAFFSIRKAAVRKVAIEQIRALAKL